ncbi:tyrosine-type recombinase/integrase [Exiguobacterium sp. AM39-5BH]|uniref:tyrosine-type recombinase/integrase n=1 Tax=Exiguobacterium sp. AM39-5BH TaxID=2292355 RepID=UPI000FE25BE7|nr:tyrosine-type recombinase/integrase [Exiguobacterium sp. AM39-5BH]RHB51958.1 site-specific recombinase [Exiguobacterium sp. AM39-5BH]
MTKRRKEYPLPEYIEAYLFHLGASGRQPSTLKRYRYDLIDVHKYFHDHNVELDAPEAWLAVPLESWKTFVNDFLIEEKQYQQATVARIVTVINSLTVFLNPLRKKMLAYAQPAHTLTIDQIALPTEFSKLVRTIRSTSGLSENQLQAHPYLVNRNELIVTLFYKYGLRVHHIIRLRMNDLHLASHEFDVYDRLGNRFTLKLSQEDQTLLMNYLADIPTPVRPRWYSDDPVFVSFDFSRMTFRWVYAKNQPKQLTIVMITKMMRQLNERSGLTRSVTPSMLRNAHVLKTYATDMTSLERMNVTCMHKESSLRRYEQAYVEFGATLYESGGVTP